MESAIEWFSSSLGKKGLVVVDVTQLAFAFVVALEIPVWRGSNDEVHRFIRDEGRSFDICSALRLYQRGQKSKEERAVALTTSSGRWDELLSNAQGFSGGG